MRKYAVTATSSRNSQSFSTLQMERAMNGTILNRNDSASKDMVRMMILRVTKALGSQELLEAHWKSFGNIQFAGLLYWYHLVWVLALTFLCRKKLHA